MHLQGNTISWVFSLIAIELLMLLEYLKSWIHHIHSILEKDSPLFRTKFLILLYFQDGLSSINHLGETKWSLSKQSAKS